MRHKGEKGKKEKRRRAWRRRSNGKGTNCRRRAKGRRDWKENESSNARGVVPNLNPSARFIPRFLFSLRYAIFTRNIAHRLFIAEYPPRIFKEKKKIDGLIYEVKHSRIGKRVLEVKF